MKTMKKLPLFHVLSVAALLPAACTTDSAPLVGEAHTCIFLPTAQADGSVEYRWDAEGSQDIHLYNLSSESTDLRVTGAGSLRTRPGTSGTLVLHASTSTTSHSLSVPTDRISRHTVGGVNFTFTPSHTHDIGDTLEVAWDAPGVAAIDTHHLPDAETELRINKWSTTLYRKAVPLQEVDIILWDAPGNIRVEFTAPPSGEPVILPLPGYKQSAERTDLPIPH